jgi:hypothetical protein
MRASKSTRLELIDIAADCQGSDWFTISLINAMSLIGWLSPPRPGSLAGRCAFV